MTKTEVKLYDVTDAAAITDELGRLQAEIAELRQAEKVLRELLIASGESPVEGNHYRATVSRYIASRTDWRAVAEKLSPSRQLIAAHTKKAETVRVAIKARKTD